MTNCIKLVAKATLGKSKGMMSYLNKETYAEIQKNPEGYC